MLVTLKNIPDLWKAVITMVAVFVAGFTVSLGFQSLLALPDQVHGNAVAIEKNRAAIEGVTAEMSLLRLELRVANCIDLRQVDPGIDLHDCINTSIARFIPKQRPP